MWYHFTFTSGANPYVAMDEKNAKKNIRHWKRKGFRVEELEKRFYLVYDC